MVWGEVSPNKERHVGEQREALVLHVCVGRCGVGPVRGASRQHGERERGRHPRHPPLRGRRHLPRCLAPSLPDTLYAHTS